MNQNKLRLSLSETALIIFWVHTLLLMILKSILKLYVHLERSQYTVVNYKLCTAGLWMHNVIGQSALAAAAAAAVVAACWNSWPISNDLYIQKRQSPFI